MSFLNNVRLVFSGRFQADVSTVNNDVRHFDNKSFDPAFQGFQTATGPWDGWWNPTGSGAFRLIDCSVVAANYADGSQALDSKSDPAVGMRIAGSDDRSSGKLVDIDPQWQLASAPWGLEMRLADANQPKFFGGVYKPHAFRDLWFGRVVGGGGDSGAAATFQSVLTDIVWAEDLKGSRCLGELITAAQQTGALSVRLTTFSFVDDAKAPDFTLGTVVGVIGPQLQGEPESFVLGRRFAPANGSMSWNGCGYFSGRIDHASRRLFLDLGNALQLATPPGPPGALNDIGDLVVGVLKQVDTAEFTPASTHNFLPIGAIDYRQAGWLMTTSGVVALPLEESHLALLADHPLALAARSPLNAGTGLNGEFGQIAIRETTGGLFVEAEPAVHRMDAPAQSTATIYAMRYGAPLADAEIAIAQVGRMPGQGGGQPSGPGTPSADIPDIGVPMDKLHVPPSIKTGSEGKGSLTLAADDPGNPRKYIDGQIYLVDFRLAEQGNQARGPFDYIVAHVRDAFTIPDDPTWADVAPIFTQYGNLYPIMSHGLFDIADPAVVKRHAKILRLAFALPEDHPGHMPATRDLSLGKRSMILMYLTKIMDAGDPVLDAAIDYAPSRPRRGLATATADVATDPEGGKTQAANAFDQALGRARTV